MSCPVCSPSRAGILTGRYQERFGHESNPIAAYDDKFGLPQDQVTLANVMQNRRLRHGRVRQMARGKHPRVSPAAARLRRILRLPRRHARLHGAQSIEQQGWNSIRRGDEPVDEKEYLTDAISREAVSFIDRHHDQPFFMYVAYNAVHVPQQAPPKYLDRFPDVKDHSRQMMLAMLSAEDDGVGKILAKLRE